MSNYKVPERAEMTFAAVRHETGDELEALGEGCRVAAAEEMRRLVAEAISLGRDRAKHFLNADVLIARADYLDPEGATR